MRAPTSHRWNERSGIYAVQSFSTLIRSMWRDIVFHQHDPMLMVFLTAKMKVELAADKTQADSGGSPENGELLRNSATRFRCAKPC